MWSLFQSQDDLPPPPPRSSVYVMRNGHYEPQNLMPVMPRPDILDFDGFVLRRGASNSRSRIRPPDLRQASLVKNPVSVRKGSVRIRKLAAPTPAPPRSADQGTFVLSCLFDALSPGTLSIFLGVTEIEHNDTVAGGPVQRRIELLSKESVPGIVDEEQKTAPARPFHEMRFSAGPGQVFDSPPWNFDQLAEENQSLDLDRPQYIPIAIQLVADEKVPESESETQPDQDATQPERCIHYTYVSIQKAAATPSSGSTEPTAAPEEGSQECPAAPEPGVEPSSPSAPSTPREAYQVLSSQVYLQKLEHSGQCFILHEVFGAGPTNRQAGSSEATRRPSLADADAEGSPDCVICLSEPRDTAVLPCRHMCFCSYCAGIVRLQCDRCPVCRQKVHSLLQFKRAESSPTQPSDGTMPKDGGGYTTDSANPSVPLPVATS